MQLLSTALYLAVTFCSLSVDPVQSAQGIRLDLRDSSQFPDASVIVDPTAITSVFTNPVITASPSTPPTVTQVFGPTATGHGDTPYFSKGLFFPGRRTDSVLAIGDGTVVGTYTASQTNTPFAGDGNVVLLRHSLPFAVSFQGILTTTLYSVYMQLNAIEPTITAGRSVTKGSVLGQMGQTGTLAVPAIGLRFETRLATPCSLEYRLANPTSSFCFAYSFDPQVNPFLFIPANQQAISSTASGMSVTAMPDWSSVTVTTPSDARTINQIVFHTAISTGGAVPDTVLDFNLRIGFNANRTSLLNVLSSMPSWGGSIVPRVISGSNDGQQLQFLLPTNLAALVSAVSVFDTWGDGVRASVPRNQNRLSTCPEYFDARFPCNQTIQHVFDYLSTRLQISVDRFILLFETPCSGSPPAAGARFRIAGMTPRDRSALGALNSSGLDSEPVSSLLAAPPATQSVAPSQGCWPWCWWFFFLLTAALCCIFLIIAICMERKLMQRSRIGYRSRPQGVFVDPAKTTRRFDVIEQLKHDEEGDATKVAMTKQKALVSDIAEDDGFPLPPPLPLRPLPSTGALRQRRALEWLDGSVAAQSIITPPPPPPARRVVSKCPLDNPATENNGAAYRLSVL
jgi:hypothetical protein